MEWLVNSVMCFFAPMFIYWLGGFELGLIYVLCVIASSLTRIGDLIRSK